MKCLIVFCVLPMAIMALGQVKFQRVPNSQLLVESWTTSRMTAAKPLPIDHNEHIIERFADPDNETADDQGKRWPYDYDLVARTNGRLFFKDTEGVDRYCSAGVVRSYHRSLAMTSAYCLHNGQEDAMGKFFTDVMFVPNYHKGEAIFGKFAARTLTIHRSNTQKHYDIGAIIVDRSTKDDQLLEEATIGAMEFYKGDPVDSPFILHVGYPSNAPFDGEMLRYCSSTARARRDDSTGDRQIQIPCLMQKGARGGPFLILYNGQLQYYGANAEMVGTNDKSISSQRYNWDWFDFYRSVRDN